LTYRKGGPRAAFSFWLGVRYTRGQSSSTPLEEGVRMSAFFRVLVGMLACLSLLPLEAAAWNRSPAVEFATLPQPLRHPEGLCVDRLAGEFYVTDFDYQATSPSGRIAVFDESGR